MLSCNNIYNVNNKLILEPQSGDATIFRTSDSTQQNVEFGNQHDPYIYAVDSSTDPTRSFEDMTDVDLNRFFSRPIKIAEREWSTSVNLDFDIDPWSLFFENPRVLNRITNFNLLRAVLHVKIVINGNGFQYGRMLVSYNPLDGYDDMSTNSALVRQDLVQASQLPHVFLNPTMSTGGELRLPMFYHRNYISIPDALWYQMGRLYFRTLNPLKHANGANDVVTVSVFAWAEDVTLSMLTSIDTGSLVPQSGEIDEANLKGVISGPATAVSRAASILGRIPYIGPFARATEIGASAVAGIAKVFGYSRPLITKSPEPYKPTITSSLAVTTLPDTSQKLTLDDKQELSIDPRIAGISPMDPMNIAGIAQRESYLTTFAWNIGTAPETLLWNSRVSPVTWVQSATAGQPTKPGFHFPACAFAALPFKYWRGTMKFRFQIVASAFHKGRLKVVFDPYSLGGPDYLGFTEYNVNYLRIVDIADEADFTIEVGNAQPVSYLDHAYPGQDSVTEVHSTTPYISKGDGNGVIAVYIVNELTSPNSTINNDIEVNVFVSMGDDFEVAVPEDTIERFILQPQSGTAPDTIALDEMDAPMQTTSTVIGQGPTYNNHLSSVFIGETIASFRPLLKRFTLWNALPVVEQGPVEIDARFPAFPYYRGYGVGGADLNNYNYVNTLLIHWVRWAHSGARGSIRYKIIPRGPINCNDLIQVQRGGYKGPRTNQTQYDLSYNTMPRYDSTRTLPDPQQTRVSQARRYAMPIVNTDGTPGTGPMTGMQGAAIAHGCINQAMEVEIPYYSQCRFTPGKKKNLLADRDEFFEDPWDLRIFASPLIDGTYSQRGVYDFYAAAGEDFQVYFFTGLPRLYWELTPPIA